MNPFFKTRSVTVINDETGKVIERKYPKGRLARYYISYSDSTFPYALVCFEFYEDYWKPWYMWLISHRLPKRNTIRQVHRIRGVSTRHA